MRRDGDVNEPVGSGRELVANCVHTSDADATQLDSCVENDLFIDDVVTFLISLRLICGGEVDASPATLEPSLGLIHDPAAGDGLAPRARAAATASASLRRREDALGGELKTSSSSMDVVSAAIASCPAILPQLLCLGFDRPGVLSPTPYTTDNSTCTAST